MNDELRVPESKMAEARTLWEVALIYLALGAAARVITSAGSPQQVAAAGYLSARLLAEAYYRLVRAAWTGYTLAHNGRGTGQGELLSLLELYEEFETLAFAAIPRSKHAETRSRMAAAARGEEDALDGLVPDGDLEDPEDRFPTTEVNGDPISDLDYRAKRSDERGWSIVRDIVVEELEESENRELEEALKELDRRLEESRKAERRREKAAAEKPKATRQGQQDTARRRRSLARTERASATMKAAQSGARDTINTMARDDPRAIGWVRVPHHPTPCGWCLMLASRGIILYRSAATARSAWHENCHCTAEPVFSRDHYFTSPQFAKNRALYVIWRQQGFGKGREGERDFRNYFLRGYRRGVNLYGLMRENAARHSNNLSQEDT